jgi:hypothetical protein
MIASAAAARMASMWQDNGNCGATDQRPALGVACTAGIRFTLS